MKNFKKDFPIFENNKNLVYLDSAATSQKPQIVIDVIVDYYENYNANIRRGLYSIAEKATEKVEEVRRKTAKFINAKSSNEIIFVNNATEGINLVSKSYASQNVREGDAIAVTIMEHHSNFVPWQQLCIQKNAKLEVLDIDNDNDYKFKIQPFGFAQGKNSKLLAITHVSNVLGVINPIKEIIKQARKINPEIKILVDGAQSAPHIKVDVQDLDCDFLVFSGHKMLSGTGIGVLYGKKELLKQMTPFLLGGGMIKEVTIEKTTFADLPYKFEAGTLNVAGIISLGEAIDYLEKIGMENIQKYEQKLTRYCLDQMEKIKGIKIYGSSLKERIGVIAFNLEGVHSHDVAQILGDLGICIRAGHHCCMPLHKRLGVGSTARISFYIYNNEKDVDELIKGLKKVKEIFKI